MEQNQSEILGFLLKELPTHPNDIIPVLTGRFNFSRQRAHFYISREIKKGTIIRVGNTRAARYFSISSGKIQFRLHLAKISSEDRVWTEYIKPMLFECTENVRRIANYGFTEMLNNIIDHSEGSEVWLELEIKDGTLFITLMDNGVGIFKKIQNALHLKSERESILHLSKGRFTTDPSKHSGQGIFFTSRMFKKFALLSDDLYYTFGEGEWFVSNEKPESFGKGTYVAMQLPLDVNYMPNDTLKQYSDIELGFYKTNVAVALSSDPGDPHNSRSQAKRLLMGLEKFKSVTLDFKGVDEVGQAFVDEVFRVFKNEYPDTVIQYVNANSKVQATIKRGLADAEEGQISPIQF